MDSTLDYYSLSKRFSKIKNELNESLCSLKKFRDYEDKSKCFVPSGCNKQVFGPLTRSLPPKDSPIREDKLPESSESEESSSNEDSPSQTVVLQSTITATVGSSKARRKFISTHNSDQRVQLRHRRFLGLVQNTLRKFQDEEIKRQPQDLKRKKVLEKVEAVVEEKKNSAKRKKAELRSTIRKQELELECLEKMLTISESFESWADNQKNLLNYIGTKTEPKIFFLPAVMSTTSKKQLERSRMKIKEGIKKQTKYVEATLFKIQESYNSSFEDNEDTLLVPQVDSSQNKNMLRTEIATKMEDTDETLHLNVSENECDGFSDISY